jgi:DNA-binding transcriptional regulator LsrR (DeoR family)
VSDQRDELLRQLGEHAESRRRALEDASAEMEEIARLIPAAIEAGISKREISRRTGVSRTWIDELLDRGDSMT